MSGQQQSFESIDIFEEDRNNFNMCEKFKAVFYKLKVPFLLLLLILVLWITFGVKVSNMKSEVESYERELEVKVSNMESEIESYKKELTVLKANVDSHEQKLTDLDYEVDQVDSNQKKLTYDSFHSRAASAEDCEELRNHGFSTSGYFLIGNNYLVRSLFYKIAMVDILKRSLPDYSLI